MQEKSFEGWMKDIDSILEQTIGLSSSDLPDFMYREAYDNGAPADETAGEVLSEAEWFTR